MHPWQRVLVILAHLLLLVGVVVAGTGATSVTDDGVIAALALNVVIRLLPLICYRRDFGWFHPVVFGAVFGFLDLLRQFQVYANGLTYHVAIPTGGDDLNHLIVQQLLLSSMGLIAYYIGFLAGPRLPLLNNMRFAIPKAPARGAISIILVAAGVWSAYVSSQGGVGGRLFDLAGGRRNNLSGSYYLLLLVEIAIPAWWAWLAYSRSFRVRHGIGGLIVVAMHYTVFGGRAFVVYAGAIALIIWSLRERAFPYVRVVGLGLAGIYCITVLGRAGAIDAEGGIAFGDDAEQSFFETVIGGFSGEISDRATSSSGALPIFEYVPETVDYLYGASYLGVIASPIPRAIWPDKPGLIGGRVGATFFNVPSGVPPGAAGEAFWNFGAPGVVLVFGVFGVWHRWLGRMFLAHSAAPGMLILYATTLVLLPNPSSAAFATTLRWLALVVIVLVAVRGMRPGARHAIMRDH